MSSGGILTPKKLSNWIRYKYNRNYKDRFFCLIFGTEEYKDKAVSLYNALNSSDYKADELEIYTIRDFIYINRKNDVAYLIHGMVSLYEHQSTINPNMPIRGLIYYGELYSKYIAINDLKVYGNSVVRLPTPQYIVFYNGTDKAPAIEDLRLSDAFIKEPLVPGYEWTARVINLNSKENQLLLDICKPLGDYCIFNEKVREYSKSMARNQAVDRAVDECIEEGILDDILLSHKAEVKKMFFTENQEKRYIRHVREEAREEATARFKMIISDKDAEIQAKDAEIVKLKEELAEYKKN